MRFPSLTFILLLGLFFLTACRKQEAAKAAPAAFKPNTGQIQILNGSGKSGVAEAFRDYLIRLGFDVIEFGNARNWNYENTLVLSRTESDSIARVWPRRLEHRGFSTFSEPLRWWWQP